MALPSICKSLIRCVERWIGSSFRSTSRPKTKQDRLMMSGRPWRPWQNQNIDFPPWLGRFKVHHQRLRHGLEAPLPLVHCWIPAGLESNTSKGFQGNIHTYSHKDSLIYYLELVRISNWSAHISGIPFLLKVCNCSEAIQVSPMTRLAKSTWRAFGCQVCLSKRSIWMWGTSIQ